MSRSSPPRDERLVRRSESIRDGHRLWRSDAAYRGAIAAALRRVLDDDPSPADWIWAIVYGSDHGGTAGLHHRARLLGRWLDGEHTLGRLADEWSALPGGPDLFSVLASHPHERLGDGHRLTMKTP